MAFFECQKLASFNLPNSLESVGNLAFGEYAMFVAGASNYDRIEWRFTSPNGGEYSLDGFRAQFPYCSVDGQGTTTLVVHNIQPSMEGWRAYCRF